MGAVSGARNRSRTCTSLRTHDPESCASTNSAIRAFADAKIQKFPLQRQMCFGFFGRPAAHVHACRRLSPLVHPPARSRGAGRAVRSNAQAARSCPANVAGVAPHWSPRRHGRPAAGRHRFKHKVLEKLKLFLSRTKPAVRRHSRSYGKDGQCRYRQKEQNLV